VKRKTINEIIVDYLEKNDFDGLAGDECGCTLDDLFCCDLDCSACIPAYKVKPTKEYIDMFGNEEQYMMSLSKKGRIK
jgi:hypothetical protein